MEKGPDKKFSKLKEASRLLVAGAAVLGAVTAEPHIAHATEQRSVERQDSFDFRKEAEAFITEIASLDAGIDDARGRHRLKVIINSKLGTFALACGQRKPYFSSSERSRSQSGVVTNEMREAAKRYLSRFSDDFRPDNLPLRMLKQILDKHTELPEMKDDPSLGGDSEGGSVHFQDSEIRRSPMRGNDW